MLEGRGGKGCCSFSLELCLVLHFVHAILGGGSGPQSTGVQSGGCLSHGLGGSVSMQALKLPKELVGYRSYAEVSKERPATFSSTRGIFGNLVSTSLKG